MAKINKTGDWDLANRLMVNLSRDLEIAAQNTLKQLGLKAEAIAKGHIQNQDLGWAPLSAKYQKWKSAHGRSTNILVSTSTYFQTITSWFVKNKALVGVKKGSKDKNGNNLADIAKTLEYGSIKRNIPARPLWKPTMEETRAFAQSSNLLKKNVIQQLKKYRK